MNLLLCTVKKEKKKKTPMPLLFENLEIIFFVDMCHCAVILDTSECSSLKKKGEVDGEGEGSNS